ncbi:Vesicle transport v-SNARE protein [Dirofilaria immitis]|nr:Vesicle transport v-SNARE protein [Dirofilaria immitis]
MFSEIILVLHAITHLTPSTQQYKMENLISWRLKMWPSTSTEKLPEYVVVSYPGVVKNAEKAIKTLGGIQTLSMFYFPAHLSSSNVLYPSPNIYWSFVESFCWSSIRIATSLKNLYANALISERGSTEKSFGSNGTILCVAAVRRKKSDPNCVQAKVIGMVSTIYTFKSMCDFHYLPIRQSETFPGCFENLVPKLIPLDLPGALSWWNQPENERRTPLHLPPYQFSRYSVPSSKLLCKETDFHRKKKALSVTVHSTAEFPKQPTEEAINDANIRCKNDEPHRLLQDLFEERPMWTRVGILKKTGLDDGLIKTLLQKFAFYILNGPWGRLWCRFGYDPRIDPNAKQYQSVMVTFRQHAKIPERQRLKIITKNSERPGHVSVTSGSSLAPAIPSTYGSITEEHIDYMYIPGELPRVRQMWYCICDVKLPIAEEIKAVDRIRDAIKEDVKKLSSQIEEEEGIPDEAEEDWWTEQSTDQQSHL